LGYGHEDPCSLKDDVAYDATLIRPTSIKITTAMPILEKFRAFSKATVNKKIEYENFT